MLPALISTHSAYLWHLLPLAAVVSLVYSASRYELTERILRRAARLFVQILVFMAAVFFLLWALSLGL
jgi:cation transport ATPase